VQNTLIIALTGAYKSAFFILKSSAYEGEASTPIGALHLNPTGFAPPAFLATPLLRQVHLIGTELNGT
jgi:hypothetical protein